MRVAVLWTHLSGYLNACLLELAKAGHELFVGYQRPDAEAPFLDTQFSWIPHRYSYELAPNGQELMQSLEVFHPDLFLVSGWHKRAYRHVCRQFAGRTMRVCCVDNPWEGTVKQWGGVLTSRWYLHSIFDAIFVPGERQAVFARKLGFAESCIWQGLLACDHDRFRTAYDQRLANSKSPCSFLYPGRLSAEKGTAVLADAYRNYRQCEPRAWPLVIAGEGPLRHLISSVPGIAPKGFVQPEELPGIMREAGCCVLPSLWDHWGVAVHEATAAGLPVICTSRCGAAVHLVRDRYNGYIVEPGNADALVQAMARFSRLSDERRRQMGDASYLLSLQFTPQRWAEIVIERAAEFRHIGQNARYQCVGQA
jgi:glycosyltransferase involved in cell wall biosynthesis